MKAILWFASCAIAGNMVHFDASAQSVPITAAVEAAWNRSVQSTAVQGQAQVAEAHRAAAQSLWAAPPSLELSHRTDRPFDNAGRSESEVGIAWPVWLPGQRAARRAAGQADVDIAEAAQRAAKLRIAGEVREAAWALIARQAESLVAKQHTSSLESLASDVERRVRSGDLARADALAARAEFLAASASAADATQRLEAAKAQWKVLTGMEQVADAVESSPAPAASQHPELVLAILTAQGARNRFDVVRATRREPPELMLRYRQDTAGSGLPAEKSIGLAIRIPFGTDDRNLPREKAALAELEVAQAEERRLRRKMDAETETANAAVSAAERQLAFESARVDLLRERAALVERSFRAGETALPELLRASAAAAQAEAAFASQQAALGLTRARLQQTIGRLP
jgi:outer membrane protein, heavy metal efflux system